MRCISPHSRYSIQVFEGREEVVVDARGYASSVALAKPVIADFNTTGLLDHEIEKALEWFSFSGLPEGVSPLAKISVFDTDAFCMQYPEDKRDEMQAQIEERLRVLEETAGGGAFRIVDQPRAQKPWPSYDDNSVEDILKFQAATGIRAEVVRLYEEENLNRPEIVSAMLRQDDPEGAEALYGPAEEEGESETPHSAEEPKEAFTVGT